MCRFVHDSAAYILISVRVKGANLRHIVQELFVILEDFYNHFISKQF